MNTATEDAIAVFITAPNREEASRLAEMLIQTRLAGCVQILPGVESVYRWQGQIERSEEFLLIAKTASTKFVELEKEVRAIHSYETPEIVAVPVVSGSQPYLEWLMASVSSDREVGA